MKKKSPGKIIKWVAITGAVVLILLLVFRPEWFPGIRYPLRDFDFELLNPVDKPDLQDREPGEAYPEGFAVRFRHSSATSQFTFESGEHFYGNRPRKTLYVKEAAWEWKGGSGIFAQDVLEKFSEIDWLHPVNGWYISGFRFIPDRIPFVGLFRQKKMGEVFPFRLTIRYQFDDEPEAVQVLEYRVTAVKGKYKPTYWLPY